MNIAYDKEMNALSKYYVFIYFTLMCMTIILSLTFKTEVDAYDMQVSIVEPVIIEPEVEPQPTEKPVRYFAIDTLVDEEPNVLEGVDYHTVSIPEHKDFKSFMSYESISSWYQQDLQDVAYDGEFGIRMVDDRYCIAVGTACNAQVGDYVVLCLENGVEIDAIVGDIKADAHTQDNNLITSANSCCSEFVVNPHLMDPYVKVTGNMSNCKEEWKSPVVEIKVYDYNYLGLE